MTALVLFVILDWKSWMSIVSVWSLISQNTGFPPPRMIAFAVETNVKLGRITSSPGFRSIIIIAISSACVQEVVRSAWFSEKRLHNDCSTALHIDPSPLIFPESRTRLMSSMTEPLRYGLLKGMFTVEGGFICQSRPPE